MLLDRELQRSGGDDTTLKIFSWNTLAYMYCKDEDAGFPYVDEKARDPDIRRLLHVIEVSSCNADIIVLQEVDNFNLFASCLFRLGYDAVPSAKGDHYVVVFYKQRVLELKTHTSLTDRILTAEFVHLKTKKRFRLGAVHLKAKEGNENIRYKQISSLLSCGNFDFVVGDFNDTPASPVCKYMHEMGFSFPVPAEGFTTLKSRPDKNGEMTTTRRTIDYIWFKKERIHIVTKHTASSEVDYAATDLLSSSYPSDHLSQMVEFEFKSYV